MLPINNWSKPLRVSEVAAARNRPPDGTGLVYVVSGVPDPAKDVRYVGSGHSTASADGLARTGALIGAMLGFDLWHSGGIKLYKTYPPDLINNLYVIWASIDGCPILAERALRLHHLDHPTESPEFKRLDGGEPRRNAVCNRVCIPQNLGWSEKLNELELDAGAKQQIIELMKIARENSRKTEALTKATAKNGTLDKANVDSALDRILAAMKRVNMELDTLLAKARE